jgi:mRNA interferase HigB
MLTNKQLYLVKSCLFVNTSLYLSYPKAIPMHIITARTINKYAEQYPEAGPALQTWVSIVKVAEWNSLIDVRKDYPSADLIGDDRFVFNIKGNHYRLVVRISFQYKNLMMKWFGPHKDYDKINARTV